MADEVYNWDPDSYQDCRTHIHCCWLKGTKHAISHYLLPQILFPIHSFKPPASVYRFYMFFFCNLFHFSNYSSI